MRIGIHPDHFKEESFSKRWAEAIEARGSEVVYLDLLAPNALDQVQDCDGVMWRWTHNPQHKQSAKNILYTIEHILNKPVFPNSRTCWHYDEKISQYYLLAAIGAPTPKTWLFWDRFQAKRWAESVSFPVVFKLSSGAGSSNVILVNDRKNAEEIIDKMFSGGVFPYTLNGLSSDPNHATPPFWKPEIDYVYFQEYLAENCHDTRITVIGERAFGFRRYNRPGDFRASGSGLVENQPEKIDHRMINLAFSISAKCNFQSMAFDFLYSGGLPVIAEISYNFADKQVRDCSGFWDPLLVWHPGSMWPEDAQVDDFLRTVEAKRFESNNVIFQKPDLNHSPENNNFKSSLEESNSDQLEEHHLSTLKPKNAWTNQRSLDTGNTLPKVLLIIDKPNWIFHRHADALQHYLGDQFEFSTKLQGEGFQEGNYDLIYPLEFNLIDPEQIHNPAKYVTGIRSHVSWANYEIRSFIQLLREKFAGVHVVSKRLFDLFSPVLPSVEYITHGIEISRFSPTKPTDQSGQQLRIGWAGNRNQPLKGFVEFIQPLNVIPGVTLVHYGYADKNIPVEEMPAFYDSLDVYICASGNNEGNNNSLLEAALMERAIITTDNGTVPEYLINQENALIVERRLDCFVDAVKKLRDDPALRLKLGNKARQAVIDGGWDWSIKAQEYKRFFTNAIASQKQGLPRLEIPKNDDSGVSAQDYSKILLDQWQVQKDLISGMSIQINGQKQAHLDDLYQELERLGQAWKDQKKYITDLEQARDQLLEAIEDQKRYIAEVENVRNSLEIEVKALKDAKTSRLFQIGKLRNKK